MFLEGGKMDKWKSAVHIAIAYALFGVGTLGLVGAGYLCFKVWAAFEWTPKVLM